VTDPQPTFQWDPPGEPAGPAPGIEFAPHGARLVAYLVDAFIASAIALVLLTVAVIVLLGGGDWSDPESPVLEPGVIATFMVLALLAVVIAVAYFPFFWARGGQTPGMGLFGLRVVRDRDGGAVGWGSAILRLIGLTIGGSVFYLGYIWILIDKRRRGWHDLIAGTVVVRGQSWQRQQRE
jgi:uncharacterized RDD family membrane protein YckC